MHFGIGEMQLRCIRPDKGTNIILWMRLPCLLFFFIPCVDGDSDFYRIWYEGIHIIYLPLFFTFLWGRSQSPMMWQISTGTEYIGTKTFFTFMSMDYRENVYKYWFWLVYLSIYFRDINIVLGAMPSMTELHGEDFNENFLHHLWFSWRWHNSVIASEGASSFLVIEEGYPLLYRIELIIECRWCVESRMYPIAMHLNVSYAQERRKNH